VNDCNTDTNGDNNITKNDCNNDTKSNDDDDDEPTTTSSLVLPLFNSTFMDYLISGMKVRLAVTNNDGTKKKKKQYYRYESHYQERWPDSKQPSWSRKTIPFNNRIANENQICFVHVGKAGGSTVGCMLGFSLHCDSDNDINGILPIVTTHTFHRGVNDCADDAGYYLFVVRDPLARILSDMNYERPNMTAVDPFHRAHNQFGIKELYQDCNFWSLEDLARNGLLLRNRNNNRDDPLSNKKCRARAFDAMTGVGQYLVHGYFNYQYYAQFAFGTEGNGGGASTIPENANLLVIRNNHMVDDWNAINKFLGGQRSDVLKPGDVPVNNAHTKNVAELYLSKQSKVALCQVLCNEIQVYKDLIRGAINLNAADVNATLEELEGVCPKEAVEDNCSRERPNIRRKIEDRKGEEYY